MVDSVVDTGICVSATEYKCHQLALEQNPWPYHGNVRVSREDSTDFELSVRGHFTDSCETRLLDIDHNLFLHI